MKTFKEAFRLMAERPLSIFKMIGYEILLAAIIFFIVLISAFFLPLCLMLCIGIWIVAIIFNAVAYYDLFVGDEEVTFTSVIKHAYPSVKENGWRIVGFNLLLFVLTFSVVVVFMVIGFSNMSSIKSNTAILENIAYYGELSITTEDYFNTLLNSSTFVGGAITIVAVIPLLTMLGFYAQYTQTFISLGHPQAMKSACKQWKGILLCGIISLLLTLVPLLGWLLTLIFNFVVPLKIILDVESTRLINDKTML